VAEGLKTLKLRPDQVNIEVLNRGSRGIFGLGSEPAQVRISVPASAVAPSPSAPPETAVTTSDLIITAPPMLQDAAVDVADEAETTDTDPVEEVLLEAEGVASSDAEDTDTSDEAVLALAAEQLSKTVQLMGLEANVQAAWKEGNDDLSEHNERYLLLDVQGVELGALIGRRGETLESLQYLLRLMVNQRLRKWKNIIVDVEGYKERRVVHLKQLALRTATQVASTGRAVSLEPMPPNERRIIHIALRDHPDVYTESFGEGERRKVQIIAKN
jgi:spoIIIJ-associated protein